MKISQELSKRYYTIGEVCQMLDVAPSLIRHWEKVFDSLHTRRDTKGGRRFTAADIHELARIYTLVKERGFTLEGAREELRHPSKDLSGIHSELVDISRGLRKLIDEISPSRTSKP